MEERAALPSLWILICCRVQVIRGWWATPLILSCADVWSSAWSCEGEAMPLEAGEWVGGMVGSRRRMNGWTGLIGSGARCASWWLREKTQRKELTHGGGSFGWRSGTDLRGFNITIDDHIKTIWGTTKLSSLTRSYQRVNGSGARCEWER